MADVTLSWSEFLKESKEFFELTRRFSDHWELIKKNDNEGNTYLRCKRKLLHKFPVDPPNAAPSEMADFEDEDFEADEASASGYVRTEVLQVEYHIVYSISYQVPVFYLKVQRSDGSPLEMEQIWDLFGSDGHWNETRSRAEMLIALTQMEHPVLFKPFFAIHPCRTSQLLGQTPRSTNRVLTFISIMGPYLKLFLDNQYGL